MCLPPKQVNHILVWRIHNTGGKKRQQTVFELLAAGRLKFDIVCYMLHENSLCLGVFLNLKMHLFQRSRTVQLIELSFLTLIPLLGLTGASPTEMLPKKKSYQLLCRSRGIGNVLIPSFHEHAVPAPRSHKQLQCACGWCRPDSPGLRSTPNLEPPESSKPPLPVCLLWGFMSYCVLS